MPNQSEIASATTENEEQVQEDIARFKPGELVPIDATNDRVDLDEEDESDLTVDEKKTTLSSLADRVAQRDLVSRRIEVRDCWKARYFYRGNQHLLLGRNQAWVLPQQVLMGGQSYDDHSQETNIYLAFGDTIEAALTAGTPSVRFEAQDPKNAADIDAACNADRARLLIERNNNMIVLQEDLSRFLWTDGRALVYVRHVLDAQRYGYSHAGVSAVEDQISYLPEEGGEGPEKLEAPDLGAEGGESEDPDEGEVRGSEVIRVLGALETKLPIQANDLAHSAYLQFSEEMDITTPKAMYPEQSDDITPATSPTAESDYERLARTSIMMGMRPSSMTSDSMTYNTTVQRTWVRPSFFFEEKDDTRRQWLFKMFPKGAMVVIVGKVVCEARNESMDDHWTLIHARPGDGMHRPALGQPVIPLQEKLNDCMDLVHESFMHLIPRIWTDTEQYDVDAANDTQRAPGQYMKMQRKGDKDLAGNFFVEPQIQLAAGLLEYIQNLFGEFSQFLCGAFPALFGGNTGSNDTAQGIASQRDQALGRVGLTWRNMKIGYASIMRQAVMAAAEYRKEVMTGNVQGADGQETQIAIDPDDLKGNVLCFPDTDENFPESWVAQRAVWMNLLESAKNNPVLAAILAAPRNLLIAKDKIGVSEIVIPTAASSKKQLGEIALLLEGGPQPNPALQQAEQKLAELMPRAALDPTVEQEILQLQQQIQAIPPQISSVKVGKLDNDQIEMTEIETWANDSEGIKAAAEKQDGYANVMLHYDEHAAAMAQKAAGKQAPPATKPVSLSLSANLKDLPPEGQVQAAAEFGIKLDQQKLVAEDAQDKINEAAAAVRPQPVPATVQ
jgi:hypothetical protein